MVRNSLSKDSDYGYASSKSSNTLSSSLIETTTTNNSTVSTCTQNTTATSHTNKLSSLKQRVKKDERTIKCKSNDSFIYIKNNQYTSNSIRSKSASNNQPSKLKHKFKSVNNNNMINNKLDENESNNKLNLTECSTNTNISLNSNTNLDYDSDLNKVLDSEAFIDLDDLDCTRKNISEMNNQSKQHTDLTDFNKSGVSTLDNIKESISSQSSVSSSSAHINIPSALTASSISPSASIDSTSLKSNMNSLTKKDKSQSSSSANTSHSSSPMVMNESITVIEDEHVNTAYMPVDKRQSSANNNKSNRVSRSSRLFNTIIRMSTIATSSTSSSTSSSCSPNQMDLSNKNNINNYNISENRKSLSNKFFKTFNNQNTSINIDIKDENCEDEIDSLVALDLSNFSTNMDKWTPSMVRVWLENIGMLPTHIKSAIKNIKNGKSLLTMNEHDFEKVFGLNNQLHKRKLKLAIDELKFPEKCKYPKLNEITTAWLTNVWLKQIGLVQYQNVFKANLIDGRVLASLHRKDLEKFLGIHKRHIQNSLLIAIDFLRKYDFDINVIYFILIFEQFL
jgi:hypothetical protein